MTQKTTQRKGPWHKFDSVIRDADGLSIGQADDYGKSRDEQLANAAFIVQACNAHDDLVAAAKGILDHMQPTGTVGSGYRTDRCGKYLQQLRAALAKAGAAP